MRFREPDEVEVEAWKEWIRGRPSSIRKVAARFDPWTLYRLKDTGHRVTLYSFYEPGEKHPKVTVSVNVLGQFNLVAFERRVFGIDPDELEECDLPAKDEPLGSANMDPREAMQAALGTLDDGTVDKVGGS